MDPNMMRCHRLYMTACRKLCHQLDSISMHLEQAKCTVTNYHRITDFITVDANQLDSQPLPFNWLMILRRDANQHARPNQSKRHFTLFQRNLRRHCEIDIHRIGLRLRTAQQQMQIFVHFIWRVLRKVKPKTANCWPEWDSKRDVCLLGWNDLQSVVEFQF